MKMRSILGKRGFAVFTSLVLCTSLVLPSFAASFSDLQDAVRGKYTGTGITVTEGDGKRTVTLNEDVIRTGNEGHVTVNAASGGGAVDVTINLQGHTIDGTGGKDDSVFLVTSGSTLTLKDSTASVDEETGEYTAGKITGGTASGVQVNGGTFNMEGGTITGNSISTSGAGGGGVYVSNGGSFTMDGGAITDNEAILGSGGGVGVKDKGSSFTMNGGVISGNTVDNDGGNGGGGGVWVKSGAEFTMSGGTITGNTVVASSNGGGNGGGVAIHQATFNMERGSIYGNTSPYGIGVLINAEGGNAEFNMSGGYVKGQDGKSCIYLEEDNSHNAVFNLSGDAIMAGTIFLGNGTEIKTDNVRQNGSEAKYPHELKGFTANGSEGIEVTAETTNGGHAVTADTELDTVYDCTWDETVTNNGNGKHSTHCEICGASNPETTADHDWVEGDWVTSEDGESRTRIDTCSTSTCTATRKVTEDIPKGPEPSAAPVEPETPVTPAAPVTPPVVIDDDDVPLGAAPEEAELEEIEDEAVPLAGLFTRADAIGYLWQQTGSPDAELSDFADVPEDHQWAVAIGWAQDMGIAVADEEGNFRPDDLLLRSNDESEGEFQEFLNRYAVFAGIELDADELFIELDGEPDDIIMGEDAQEIFDGFFARLETTLARRRD